MRLRSSGTVSKDSGKGNRKGKKDSSDSEDNLPPASVDNGDVSNVEEEKEAREILDSDEEAGVTDYEEPLCGLKKKRRVGSKKKRLHWTRKKRNAGVRIDEVDEDREDMGVPVVEEEEPIGLDDVEAVEKTSTKRRKKKTKPTLMWEIWEQENERFIDEKSYRDTELENHSEIVNETAEASSDLIIPLLRYQKEWLAWALKQEDSAVKGGILADEMGMGKTIQAIALVLAQRKIRREIGELNVPPPSSSPCSSTGLPKLNGTLVICPVAAVSQWSNEITRYTSKGSTKVLIYHGPNREKNGLHFAEYDFVITTYSIIESEYRKHLMPPRIQCQHCGKLFEEKKINYHQRYFCGPKAAKTEKQSKQVKKEGNTKLHKDTVDEAYTGKGTSIKTLKQIEKKAETECYSPSMKPILHSYKWSRIILDEAHCIKDRRSNTARGVFALESIYKWALSGTPLQNRVGELYSLVRFLQVVPFSYYCCKDCDCRILDYRPSAECLECPHKCVRHFCWWNRYIASPITSGYGDDGKRAMILLRHKLLKNILLRRTKKGRAADLALPPRTVYLRRDALDIKEEDYYKSLYNESRAQFNTYVDDGTLLNNYAHIFDLLTRLRQAVDHPYLVVYSRTAALRTGRVFNSGTNDRICGICNEAAQDVVVTACEHVFCKECLIDYVDALGQVSCPACSKPLTVDLTATVNPDDRNTKTSIKGFKHSSILNRIRLEDFQTSTKIEALREEIRFMVERDGSAKGIVFSQFTSFLDLINYSLKKSGVECEQLVGSMSITARDAAIAKFTNDPNCKIFLMSLKAGGVALNLTVASHVFLMDPWWNPAVEQQAQDRIHRIGQYKPIRIVRFVIENTIEERILSLQSKKELVFQGTVGGYVEALGRLTAEDMRFLFE